MSQREMESEGGTEAERERETMSGIIYWSSEEICTWLNAALVDKWIISQTVLDPVSTLRPFWTGCNTSIMLYNYLGSHLFRDEFVSWWVSFICNLIGCKEIYDALEALGNFCFQNVSTRTVNIDPMLFVFPPWAKVLERWGKSLAGWCWTICWFSRILCARLWV